MPERTVLFTLEARLQGSLVIAHHVDALHHLLMVVLVRENCGKGSLHDSCGHEDDVEDASEEATVILLSLRISVDDEPAHAPAWS